ncbi:MAG TPA: MotA/TolQ/ExbB proton channel family protein, partial [Candidatus Marinimicrobia bacterium]|nr:MotA/TolQ/ExbB proton channel family protein [Candidatus Neomarinimicrobiota bacterium]
MLVELFIKGGPFMWPILVVFGFAMIIVLERFYSLTSSELKTKGFVKKVENVLRTEGLEEAKGFCAKSSSPIAAIYYQALSKMQYGIEEVEKTVQTAGSLEMAFLEKNQVWLTTAISLAPMIGFTGTVSGMITAFQDIEAANDMTPAIVAGGISEALLTTLFGLVVAIIITVFQNWFMDRID